MDSAPSNLPFQPSQPLASQVQSVPPPDQAEYAQQRTAEEMRALALRMGEVAAAQVFTSQQR